MFAHVRMGIRWSSKGIQRRSAASAGEDTMRFSISATRADVGFVIGAQPVAWTEILTLLS